MGRFSEMWQEQQEQEQEYQIDIQAMEQAHQEWERQRSVQDERDMEPHQRSGYFEMMCGMADDHRKWLRENGL